MTLRAAIYTRVSTAEQNTERQISDLTAYAARQGWKIVQIYEDQGISGAKGTAERPGLEAALKGAQRHAYDILMVWSLDRLARSTINALDILKVLTNNQRHLYMHTLAVDTSTPMGTMFFTIVAAFAELERAQIVERVNSGIARAKAKGQRFGRPSIDADLHKRIVAMLEKGMYINKIAKTLKCGNSTVARIKKEIENAD